MHDRRQEGRTYNSGEYFGRGLYVCTGKSRNLLGDHYRDVRDSRRRTSRISWGLFSLFSTATC